MNAMPGEILAHAGLTLTHFCLPVFILLAVSRAMEVRYRRRYRR